MADTSHNKSALVAANHCSTHIELMFRVAQWLGKRRTTATWQEVADAFQCDRATAYRWLSIWRDATGQTPIPSAGGKRLHLNEGNTHD